MVLCILLSLYTRFFYLCHRYIQTNTNNHSVNCHGDYFIDEIMETSQHLAIKKLRMHNGLILIGGTSLLIMHHTIWYQASWIFTITSDSWSLQPHSPPRRIIQRPNYHVVCLHSTPLHDINWMLEKTQEHENWIEKHKYTNLPSFQACSTPQSRITCSVFPLAANTCSPP